MPGGSPSLAPSPSSSVLPSSSSAPSASPSPDAGAAEATALLAGYEQDLIAGRWAAAWALLSPASQQLRGDLAAYTSERSAYYASVKGRYELSAPSDDPAVINNWASPSLSVAGADLGRSYVLTATYPALAGNNAGWEVFLVGPQTSGGWRIWELR